MAEEDDEDDCGIMIRIDAPTPTPSNVTSAHSSPKHSRKNNNGDQNETSV